MAYFKKIVKTGKVIEIEKYQRSNRKNLKNQSRDKKQKPTSEQMALVNELHAEKKLRRLINSNFGLGDLHTVLTYKRGQHPPPDIARKHLDKFMQDARRSAKKAGGILKYITVTEYVGKNIHHHLIISGVDSKIINSLWLKDSAHGHVHFTPLDSTGQYKHLAAYLIKETSKSFRDKTAPYGKRWNASRNLVKPVETVKKINAKQWRKTPSVPTGYMIESDSIMVGANPFTGLEWQKYTIVKVPAAQGKNRKAIKSEQLAAMLRR